MVGLHSATYLLLKAVFATKNGCLLPHLVKVIIKQNRRNIKDYLSLIKIVKAMIKRLKIL
jgi:hypothetical protein